ncbi:hypothetical protein WMF27_11960 [Sorangium sp. So ce281]|uniref:hypothetical protein n=1 Tax=unclassified Sorangium TaxID=2621164 RepID=UPI003F6089AE
MKPRLPSDPRSPTTGDGPPERRAGADRGRRLALVVPGVEPVAPASDDELGAARALAEALERGEVPLADALRAAARPAGLDRADHEALLARALGDEGAPPTKAELRAAERLREALEPRAASGGGPGRGGGSGGEGALGSPDARDDLAELAVALRSAWRPAALPELPGRALIDQAFRASPARGPRRIAPVTMAALSTLAAAAAAVALIVGQIREERASVARAPATEAAAPAAALAARPLLIEARSTAALFDPAAPFPREGGQTERIDRIAAARASDLRQNRYAAWGVR